MKNYAFLLLLSPACSDASFEAVAMADSSIDRPIETLSPEPLLDAGSEKLVSRPESGPDGLDSSEAPTIDASAEKTAEPLSDASSEPPAEARADAPAPSDAASDPDTGPETSAPALDADVRDWNCGFAIYNGEALCRCEPEFRVNDSDGCGPGYACCLRESEDLCRCGGPRFCLETPGEPVAGCPG